MSSRRTAAALLVVAVIGWLYFFAHFSSADSAAQLSHTIECSDDRLHAFVINSPQNGLSVYAPFAPYKPSPLAHTLMPTTSVPDHCLDEFIAHGRPCIDFARDPPSFDVIWTYVNGSDPLHRLATAYYENSAPVAPVKGARPGSLKAVPSTKFYRDHDELKHSMRSVIQNFRQFTNAFHLLTTDFPLPTNVRVENTTCAQHDLSPARVGQVPQWLDLNQDVWQDGTIDLRLWHHAQFFSTYDGTVFNSFAIESQIGYLDGVSEYFVYMNDDYFFSSPLTAFDFYSPPYGLVLRLQSDAVVQPASLSPVPPKGEWLALEQSNQLLSDRFGFRHRPYTVHEAKSGSTPLFHELSLMFNDGLRQTAANRFRAIPGLPARDTHPFFLLTHFVVERWREALLWTWVVAKQGGLKDEWGASERATAWEDLGATPGENVLHVAVQRRRTLEVAQMVDVIGPGGIGKTVYEYSSHDGYPYAELGRKGQRTWPNMTSGDSRFQGRLHPYYSCDLALSCLDGSKASEVFTRVAFEKTECGDCIIRALVRESGTLGLSAFLPDAARTFPKRAYAELPYPYQVPPHLSLASSWKAANFSLAAVLLQWTHGPIDVPLDGDPGFDAQWRDAPFKVDVRKWTLQLLHRYRFVIGNTPAHFTSLSSPMQARSMLARLKSDIALLCINDDIVMRPEEVDRIFRNWQDGMWSRRATWER